MSKHFGNCALCGKEAELTFEHIPPRKAFNDKGVKSITGNNNLPLMTGQDGRMPWDTQGLRFDNQQKGQGKYSICQSCNNNTGSWYGEEYIFFATNILRIMQNLTNIPNNVIVIENAEFFALRFFKQVISMFLSVNSGYFEDSLRAFVADKTSNGFDNRKYRVFMYLTTENSIQKLAPFTVMLLSSETGVETIGVSEIVTFPLGFVLGVDLPETYKMPCLEITEFSQCKYEKKDEFYMQLPLYECNTMIPMDFRSRDNILQCIKSNREIIKKGGVSNMQKVKLGDVLLYEQPTQYIVESTKYDDKYKTPVLTAGKTFLLGKTDETEGIYTNLPCIIFDDFTTATKYVNFPFKVKSSAMKILTAANEQIELRYFYYLMQIIKVDAQTHKRFWISEYSKIDVFLPSLPEQQRIVDKIEELFSDLDSAVADLNKTKAQLKVYRQAVLKQAFEGELSSQYRNSKKLINWQITSLDKIVLKDKNAIKAGPFGSSLKKDTYVSNGYKIYGQEQVIAGDENLGNYFIDEKKYGELSSCKISPNDILISLVGTVGKVLILSEKCKKGIINPRLVKISLNEKLMLPKFFKYYFESEYLKSLYRLKTHGATMDVLNLRMIKELPYPICDVIEQSYVVTEIEARLSICDKIEQTVNESLLKAESLRQSILKQAFEGKLVKND